MAKKKSSIPKWTDLIGMNIVAFRGQKVSRFGQDRVTLTHILFEDKATYLELHEQDPYDYHDCCSSARTIELYRDATLWERMFDKEGGFEECKPDSDPFW